MSEIAARRRGFPWLRYLLGFLAIFAFMIAPIVVAVGSGNFAAAHGCQVDEGSVHPCVIGGTDYGKTFYSLGVVGWLMLVTFPLGLVAGAALFVGMVVHLLARRRPRPDAP